jgi:hypothetical protein
MSRAQSSTRTRKESLLACERGAVPVEYMAVWGFTVVGIAFSIIALGPLLLTGVKNSNVGGWEGSKSVILCSSPEEKTLKAQKCP